jgi:hypothetical protein
MADLTDDQVRALIARYYRDELAACRELLEFGIREVQHWTGRAVKRGADRIIVFEAARGTKTFNAIIRLCRLGFGEQAVMLNRSLFEGMVVAHWVPENRREAVRLFTRHARYSGLLWWETLDRLGWLTEEDRKPSVGPKQRAELASLFGPHGTRPWTLRSVHALLKEIEHQWDKPGREHLWAMHDVAYRHANQVLHSTPYAASVTTTQETADALHMTIGASDQFLSQALLFAYWTYGQLFSLLIKVFRISSLEEFRAVWRPAEAFSGKPGRADGAARA